MSSRSLWVSRDREVIHQVHVVASCDYYKLETRIREFDMKSNRNYIFCLFVSPWSLDLLLFEESQCQPRSNQKSKIHCWLYFDSSWKLLRVMNWDLIWNMISTDILVLYSWWDIVASRLLWVSKDREVTREVNLVHVVEIYQYAFHTNLQCVISIAVIRTSRDHHSHS